MPLGAIEKHISVHASITARGAFFYRIGNPCDRATAERFSGVLGMFSNLEVKVLYPT